MSFPTSPADGQYYRDFKYNSTLGLWDKTPNRILRQDTGDTGTNMAINGQHNTLSGLTYSFIARANKRYRIKIRQHMRISTAGAYTRYCLLNVYTNGIEAGKCLFTQNVPVSESVSAYFYLETDRIMSGFTDGENVSITTAMMCALDASSFNTYEDGNAQNFINVEELNL